MSRGVANTTGKGEYRTVPGRWKGSVGVLCGDFIFRDANDSHYDKPVALFTWDTDLATTLAALHDLFRGVSNVRRLTLQTTDGGIEQGPILVNGEFTFPCAALGAVVPVGTLVTFAKQSGNAIENQRVATTTTLAHAIGRTTVHGAVGDTTLTFELEPALFKGGAQAVQ